MTCREPVDATADYVAGELPDDARAEAEAHRAGCPECGPCLESYVATIALGKAAYGGDDASLPESTVDAILAARTRRR
jgi:anti-sigma factor RsiW